MCGIAGIVSRSGLSGSWRAELKAMGTAIRHRGPDDHGFFTDRHTGETPDRFDRPRDVAQPRVAFVHRRLSILDLSEAARQPMVRGDVFLSYNGEIYNFRELRDELGVELRTHCDTEVLLEGYRRWGIDVVKRLRGIFAFAIADLGRNKVYLVRDHLGVKPLYYAQRGDQWVFASELKAIVSRGEVDAEAIRAYLTYLWIPGERTGIRGVHKLAPGTWLELDLATGVERREAYWSPLHQAFAVPRRETDDEAIAHLRGELSRVVGEQLVSDVPLGAFLSGGLDSSLIVALMGGRPSTYSVGYSAEDLAYDIVPDDMPFARDVARHFETRSTEIQLSPDVASLLPTVVETLDEPIGDPAAISSYLICKAAKSSLTVMLSGMGADELFGGYPRQRALVYGQGYRRLPRWLRGGILRTVEQLPGAGKSSLAKLGRSGKKFLAMADRDPLSHYISMETYFDDELQRGVLDGLLAATASPVPVDTRVLRARIVACTDDPLKQALLWDLVTYLPSLNLAYTDRTSMAHGVEVRVPFLDVRLVEWALGLRADALIRRRRARFEGKWLLKQAAQTLLPDSIIWRRKAGFGAPVRSWLRHDLAEMREELLAGLVTRGWFDATGLRRLQDEFLQGRRDYSLQIWMLVSLELWARRFLDSVGTP